jgi:hypothetical protein
MVLAGASAAAGPRAGHPTVAKSNFRAAAVGVVKQVGLRNYAGPNCPGKGWNCTSAKRVLQISAAGGENVAQCTNTTPVVTTGGQSCSISQLGGPTATNYAKCYERTKAVPAAVQECTIVQTGASNTAIVDQLIVQTQGSTQKGSQTASVTQGSVASGSSVLNSSSVSQDVKQNTAGSGAAVEDNAEEPNLAASGGPQAQDAFQSATVTQYAAGSGKNDSQVDQSEWQKAHGGSSQDQNKSFGTADCATGVGSSQPNVCANVFQHGVNGTNTNRLRQSIDQNARLLVVGIQNQGWFGTNGMDGQVHQDTLPLMGGSFNDVNQSKTQTANAPAGSIQQQFDPISCCGFFSQLGGTEANREVINQSADLQANGANSAQELDIEATSNSDPGSCTITQHGSVNSFSDANSGTVGPPACPFVTATMECAEGELSDGPGPILLLTDAVIIQQEGDGCFSSPPTSNEID